MKIYEFGFFGHGHDRRVRAKTRWEVWVGLRYERPKPLSLLHSSAAMAAFIIVLRFTY